MERQRNANGDVRELSVLLIGAALDDETYTEIAGSNPSLLAQTQRFNQALAEAIRDAGARLTLVSAAPVVSFPHNTRILFSGSRFQMDGIDGYQVGFVNLPVLKHVTKAVSTFAATRRALSDGKIDAIITVGAHSPFISAGFVMKKLKGIPAVAVLTDPFNVRHSHELRLVRRLKSFDADLMRLMLKRFSGLIVLAKPLADELDSDIPQLIVEGIAPQSLPWRDLAGPDQTTSMSDVPVVVYAGALSEEYGVGLLLDAHAIAPRDFKLVIAGTGPFMDRILSEAISRPNLEYVGRLNQAEICDLYSRASVLVNPRPPDQRFTRYSFPSKLLEYLASGTAVVSTRLPSIPSEYVDYVTYAEPDPASLAQAILQATGSEQQSLAARERRRRFALDRKGPKAQGERIIRFLATTLAD